MGQAYKHRMAATDPQGISLPFSGTPAQLELREGSASACGAFLTLEKDHRALVEGYVRDYLLLREKLARNAVEAGREAENFYTDFIPVLKCGACFAGTRSNCRSIMRWLGGFMTPSRNTTTAARSPYSARIGLRVAASIFWMTPGVT